MAKTELAMAMKTSGAMLEAAIAPAAVSVSVLLPSDKAIASSKFSGLGDSVGIWLE